MENCFQFLIFLIFIFMTRQPCYSASNATKPHQCVQTWSNTELKSLKMIMMYMYHLETVYFLTCIIRCTCTSHSTSIITEELTYLLWP